MDLIRFFETQKSFVETCVKNSLELVIISIIISLLVWIPVGILMTKNKRIANIVFAIANSIFCIPSLALFSIMITIPFLGLGRKSAVIALVLYSMMPMLKSVYFGLTTIDENIIEAAKGMGMNDIQILKEVRFPLAINRIFSGFRVSFIMLIGISTIATYIGEKNIGRIISSGLARQDMEMIVAGTLLISVLSLSMDFLLNFIEKNLIKRY
ncbi:MAG: ABC transporter permease [Andreesenia angusta]|nr:ABC transporter permease [Andreesenia angusta]